MRPVRTFRLLAAITVLGVTACLDDGPNQAGLGYVQRQGVTLAMPLYHFTFQNFPIDSSFTAELPLNHDGESLLVVGRQGPYRAAARMAYQITSQAQRDSIARGLCLRLVALPSLINGYAFLSASTAPHDSLTLQVETFAWNDTAGVYSDSLPVFDQRILAGDAAFSTLNPALRVRDTARIALAAAYDSLHDTVQICRLPHLQSRMATDTAHNWILYVEVSPVDGSPDSGLFRFDGGTYGATYTPDLFLGSYVKYGTNVPIQLAPYIASNGVLAQNYLVQHTGSTQTLLYGVSRGVHLLIDRDRLLDSINSRLGGSLGAVTGQFDTRFFVPYAELRLPLADSLAQVDGPYALDMQMFSDLDSTADGAAWSDTMVMSLGQSPRFLLYSYPVSDIALQKPQDSLYCFYRTHPVDSTLRQLIFLWHNSDTVYNDTFNLQPDGLTRELGLRRITNELNTQTVAVIPDTASATVIIFLSMDGVTEPNGFVDSAQNADTNFATVSRRYWWPGAQSLEVRSTRGIRLLLNRTDQTTSRPDLFLKPTDRHAFDTTSAHNAIPFPVLGEIGFPRQNGKLNATLDLYLYPLRSTP